MFTKILIANRGDKHRLAAKAATGSAGCSRSHIAWRAQRAAISPRAQHVH